MDKQQRHSAKTSSGNSPDGQRVESHDYFEKFGPLMFGRDLWKVLGYPTFAAFVMARRRGTVPVAIFEIPMRRGVFAYTEDVARWVTQVRLQAAVVNPKEEGQM